MPGHVCHIVGARPNFPKVAPVMRALERRGVPQRLVHTGQHYDTGLSDVFFAQLGIPAPDVNLGVGSGSHATQTAAVMTRLEPELLADRPDVLVVYGDVNSTAAAAMVAAKEQVPLAHVEAGLRSFDPSMPEEVNRLVTDRLSDLLLATSADAVAHLGAEGVPASRIHLVGNPMIDTLLAHLPTTEERAPVPGLPDEYGVLTLHRPSNVDDPERLREVVAALRALADELPIVVPVHPRGRARLTEAGLLDHPGVLATEPLGYVEFLALVRHSRLAVTDSGGLQEETTVLGVPCLTLRPNTERPVTITHGTNRLATPADLLAMAQEDLAAPRDAEHPVPPLWDGHAGERIADVLAAHVTA